MEATALLRAGLLDGLSVLIASATGAWGAGAPAGSGASGAGAHAGAGACAASASDSHAAGGSLSSAVQQACAELGARVSLAALSDDPSPQAQEAKIDDTVAGALAALGSIEMLVVDCGGLLAGAGGSGDGEDDQAALRVCLQSAWSVTRAVVNIAFLPARRGGRILYAAPAPDAGSYAGATIAGFENLARTLSIEWARHAITAVTIAPGAQTSAQELAALAAYLASPAGAYFSGALLDLRGAAA